MGVTLQGEKELLAKLRKLAKKYPEATAAALYQEGFGLWANAVKRAPVEYGILRNSAYATPPTNRRGEAIVEVGFGTNYAAFQHEGMGFRHPRGGEAKYLLNAMNETRSGYLSRLAKRIDANVKSGTGVPVLPAPSRPRTEGAPARRRKSRVRLALRRRVR